MCMDPVVIYRHDNQEEALAHLAKIQRSLDQRINPSRGVPTGSSVDPKPITEKVKGVTLP
jgi:hypothetical protein